MKHRIPPIQRSIENPPKSVLQNLIHSGVVLGGERELRPYLAKLIDAISLDKPVCKLYIVQTLYINIVRGVVISASRAARGLKFWLQVALGPPIAPWGRRPDPVHPDPGKPDFPEIFFSLFFASTDPLGPQGHSPEVPVPPNPDPDREIRFFRKSGFFVFSTF